MREYYTTLNGRDLTLIANYKTSLEIAERVRDPLSIAREVASEAFFNDRGIPYKPNWEFSIKDVVEVLFIGAKASEKDITRAVVEELVFEQGFVEARNEAMNYLGLIIGPAPEVPLEEAETDSGE